MSDNLLKIGTSGVLASNGLLSTTSNNIANLNTKGYIRQSTEYDSAILGMGVGRGTTDRIVNEFTLRQLRRDTSNVGFTSQYLSEATRVDTLFANSANSISTGVTDLFKQLQAANNDPANNSSRQLVLGSSQTLINKFNTLSNLVLEQRTYINQQLDTYVNEANSAAGTVALLNKEIASYGSGINTPPPLDLLDKRDEALRKLSEMMEITTLDANNGEKLVFLATGQSLVLEQGKFNMLSAEGDPDIDRKVVKLQLDFNSNVKIDVDSNSLGGKVGGLLEFRAKMLEPTQNRLGQLALAFGDSFNTQNKLGMDANGQLGKDIFAFPTFTGLSVERNTGAGQVTAKLEPGRGVDIPPNDFVVTFTAPDQFTMEALDDNGKAIAGSAVTSTITGYPATFNTGNATGGFLYGFEVTLDDSLGAFANGDQFILKPLTSAAQNIRLATTRGEDLALAGPLRGDFNINNLGNGKFGDIKVTDTDPATSIFSAPGSLDGAPYEIRFIGGDQFEIRDSANTLVGTTAVMAGGQYNNILASAGLNNYGFDFSITGVPKAGDTFTLGYNDGGFKDNRNGLKLGQLQTTDTMRKTAVASATADNKYSFNEAYGAMVGFIGEKTSQIRVAAQSSNSLLEQSTAWHESVSGVNLDEEAANLIRFQQSYAAAAKIISTSQTIFDTLLAAAR
ncbi:flagellar hook-associated protein FlgK [Rheinheimera riviphila]|uniref:Flagellar hook-associated protein 1 n=1 Tax=Rheinheimera riviphila TaxID=1834037 RepID=A0A437QJ77_9GAMM|nr:flagellar hook-associated protein FlgK [Rheinheimera riviphila]RVU34553.1 flagellar hook-associated protein FlgK [Rheinheimera riviphila]